MQKFDLKEYLEKNKKLEYRINKKEYITGQTWCMLKKQHVCLYFMLLFFSGILLELYSWIEKGRLTNSYLISVFAVAMFLIIALRTKRTAGILYEKEPHSFSLVYEKKGFLLTNTETKESVFYGWNMIKREKQLKKLKIIYVARDVYFFVPYQ